MLVALAIAVVGHPDTAQAQNGLAFSPNTVTFAASTANSGIQNQNVTVTVNGSPASQLSATVAYTPGQQGGYLSITSTVNGSQSFLTIIASPGGLQPGSYTSTVNVIANGQSASIPVTLNVFSNTTISVDQTALNFFAQQNGPAPPSSQTVNVTGNASGVPFTVATATTSGGGWLSAAQSSTTVPAQVIVGVNPGTLGPGTYNGTVTISAPQAQAQPQVISVTLTVSGQPVLVITPNPVTLLYQSGIGAPAPSVSVLVQSTSGNLTYIATLSQGNCGTVLAATGLTGTTNSQITVSATVPAQSNFQCTGSLTVTAQGAQNATVNVPVNVLVSASPLLNVYPTYANFNYSVGGAVPPSQTFNVSSSGAAALNYSPVSTAPWLLIPATPPNGFNTPGSFTLSLNQAALAAMNPGTYTANVTVTAFGAGNPPLVIPVTLFISNNPLVIATPSFVNFNYQTGTVIPAPLAVNLTSTMGSLPFTVALPTTTSTQFVAFSPASGTASSTPTQLVITPIPSVISTLGPGTYSNQVQVSGGNGTQLIQVNLTVSNSPLVNAAPQALVFNYALNGPTPATQAISLTSTGSSLPVTVNSNQSFLLVGGSPTSTPTTVLVSVAPSTLTPGTYTGQITITSGGQVLNVPVTLNVTSGISLSVAPATLSFTQVANGAAPAAQTVMVTTTGGSALPFSATTTTATGGTWLTVNGSANGVFPGNAPGPITIAVNGAALPPGTYNGSVTITSVGASNSSLVIPVTLTVTAQSLAATPATLSFNAAVAGSVPASQTISVTATAGSPVPFTATAQSNGPVNFLTVTPATGATTQSVTVSVSQAGLAAGAYTGTVTITSTVAGSVPLIVPVMFTVGAQPAPVLSQVINAASGATGPIAPGEIISLFGTSLGPITPGGLTLTPQGNVSTNLSNVQVLFDGIAAPLTYVSATQINAVVPYEVFGRATTTVVVNFNGLTAAALQLNVAESAPGIFALNASGSGPGAILNQNSTVNGASNPAAKGSTIVIYATGEGQTSPAGITGSVVG
ncbi:MAG: hypothetical protein M3Z09_13895, partial [Acidobacteriota bacterium]|nr:hypothetical protein [Acidobacteriota bacterium]